MPFCSSCNYEYVEGITICPDCGSHLVEENWEVVFTSWKDYEVEMLKDNLESAGITSTILSQKDHNFPAPGNFSVVKLLVRKEDISTALEFIQKINLENDEGENKE